MTMNERKSYPSDISREAFEVKRPDLEGFRRVTKPRKHDLYDIFCGMLYVLKSGGAWSLLPHDDPSHHAVYTYFRQWGAKPIADQASVLERLQHRLTEAEREAQGRKNRPY